MMSKYVGHMEINFPSVPFRSFAMRWRPPLLTARQLPTFTMQIARPLGYGVIWRSTESAKNFGKNIVLIRLDEANNE